MIERMSEGNEHGEFEALINVLYEVGEEVLDMRDGSSRTKPDGSPVTKGDQWSESRMREVLRLHFPHDAILGEEGTDVQGTGRTWIIDPIDGTIPYKDGDPGFSISIGCEEIGILYFPAQKAMIIGERGKGALLNGEKIELKESQNSLSKARIGFEYSVGPLKEKQKDRTQRINRACLYEHTCACATEDFRKLLAGHLDAIVLAGASVHDLGAIIPIAMELGLNIHGLDGSIDLVQQKNEKIPVIIAKSDALLQEMLGYIDGVTGRD